MQKVLPSDSTGRYKVITSRKNLGKRLYNIRAKNHLLQSDLAALLKVKQPQVSAWEQGKKIPTEKTLKKYYMNNLINMEEYAELLKLQWSAIDAGNASVKARALK